MQFLVESDNPMRDSNPQPLDSKSNALSIAPMGLLNQETVYHTSGLKKQQGVTESAWLCGTLQVKSLKL